MQTNEKLKAEIAALLAEVMEITGTDETTMLKQQKKALEKGRLTGGFIAGALFWP